VVWCGQVGKPTRALPGCGLVWLGEICHQPRGGGGPGGRAGVGERRPSPHWEAAIEHTAWLQSQHSIM